MKFCTEIYKSFRISTSTENSISPPFVPYRASFLFSQFYKNDASHVSQRRHPIDTIVIAGATSDHEFESSLKRNGSVCECSVVSPTSKSRKLVCECNVVSLTSKSRKLVSCFSGRWRQRRKDTTTMCKSKGMMAAEDFEQLGEMKYEDGSAHRSKMKILEKEVSMLENELAFEQAVHEVLKYVHHQGSVSSISIPNFLPPKVKELLEEMGQVDDEIAQLQLLISELQADLALEQETNRVLN